MTINSVTDFFGESVFNETVMRDKLPKETYKSLLRTIQQGEPLTLEVAQVVANAMKDWAIEKGATHYTHWFQPMTGITAEKHDAFISPTSDGKIIMEFSGKELIKGEPDASSFPSGGLRSTFEARGYTAWDATSYAFVKDGSLCIPTAFYSYSGEALDQKTPLLRSHEVLNEQAMKVLKLFGNPATRLIGTVGAEQEYFLIDKKTYDKRKDLIFSGRTLFGAMPVKGQEMEDHYFGNLTDRVSAYMKELDVELWKLGVNAKTKHNEVAPAQHELAPVYTTINQAADHNQLIMEMMKKLALRHDLVCLLHEKPFAGVNGSGKHNNWSISTDLGENLLAPGDDPANNEQFLIFLCAVIRAVDKYAEALRVSVANAGNDHRLGANEAPPAIISIFLGDMLANILDSIQTGKLSYDTTEEMLKTSVSSLPDLFKDSTDRNRTSPFAFTGNKFEFRMVGSTQSISSCNVLINTAVADALEEFAERLEKAEDFKSEVYAIIRDVVIENGRVIFNGNNYSDDWVHEAERRGLPNLRSTVDALPKYLLEKNIELFSKHNIFTRDEMHARYEIMVENYNKTINIEALCMLSMAKREILPACIAYSKTIYDTLNSKKDALPHAYHVRDEEYAASIADLITNLMDKIDLLDESVQKVDRIHDEEAKSRSYATEVVPCMEKLRYVSDNLEETVGKDFWPFPTYNDLLFNI